MAIDVRQFFTDMAKAAGVPDEEVQAGLKVLGNENVSKAFADRMLAQDEFSRQMDGIKSRNTQLDTWYADQLKLAQQNEQVVQQATSAVKKYQEMYGELDGVKPVVASPVDTMTKKEYEDALARQGQQALQVTKVAMWASADYLKKFNEVLDPDELEKFALSSGLPLKAAYEKFIEPKVQAITNTSFEEKLKAAKAEGLQEGLSRSGMPIDTKPREPHPFFDRKPADKAPATDRGAMNSFVEAYNEATAKR